MLIYEIIIVLCLIAITYGILTIKVNKISRSILNRYRCPWCGDAIKDIKESETISRVSDAMRGSYTLTPEYLPPKESGLKYSEETTKAIKMAHDLEKTGMTKEWVDHFISYYKEKNMPIGVCGLMLPYGIRCPDSVKMYALEKGIKIVNNGEL
jgi:hypothetical protein